MSLSSPREQEVLYPAPSPIGTGVLDEYTANRNNFFAYQVQKNLHSLFVQPEYAQLPESARVSLDRMQGLAFEGVFPSGVDFADVEGQLHSEHSFIAETANRTVQAIRHLIEKGSVHWSAIAEHAASLGYNGNGHMLRIWQDHAAVDMFTKDFGGRVAMFGSARLRPHTDDYRATEWIAQTLVEGMLNEEGKTERVITGAGPGIMEAGNKGAVQGVWNIVRSWQLEAGNNRKKQAEAAKRIHSFRSEVHSAGVRIALPFENAWNRYLEMSLYIKNFGPRKQGLVAAASGRSTLDDTKPHLPLHGRHPAFFVMKGGFGTQDEDWEVRTLNQCKKMPRTPVLLVGGDVNDVNASVLEKLVDWGTIDPKDCDIAINCQTEVEAVEKYLEYYKMLPTPRMKQLLRERSPLLKRSRISVSVTAEPPTQEMK